MSDLMAILLFIASFGVGFIWGQLYDRRSKFYNKLPFRNKKLRLVKKKEK